jgi:hypothetical protein
MLFFHGKVLDQGWAVSVKSWLARHPDMLALSMILLSIIIYFWSHLWPSHELFVSFYSDLVPIWYPKKIMIAETLRHFRELPLWSPTLLGGQPLFAHPESMYFYPVNMLFSLLPIHLAFNYSFIVNILLAGIFCYFWQKTLGRSPLAALLCALIYMLNVRMSLMIFAGLVGQLPAITCLPLALLFLERAFHRPKLVNLLFAALALSAMLTSGFTQLFVYVTYLFTLYTLLRGTGDAVKQKRLRPLLAPILIWAGVLGLAGLIGLHQILPTVQFTPYTHRASGLGLLESDFLPFQPIQAITALLPEFFGNAFHLVDASGKGWLLWETACYIGVVPLFLAIVGLISRPRFNTLFFGGVALFSLIFAFGRYTPLYAFCFEHLPGWQMFRVPSRMLILWILSLTVLAGVGFDNFLEHPQAQRRSLKYGGMILAGLMIIVPATLIIYRFYEANIIAWLSQWLKETFYPSLGIDKIPLITQIAQNCIPAERHSLVIFFAITTLLSFLLILRGMGRLPLKHFRILLVLLVLFDLTLLGQGNLTTQPVENILKDPAILPASTRLELNRTARLDDQDRIYSMALRVQQGISTTNGYDSMLLQYYLEYLTSAEYWLPLPPDAEPYRATDLRPLSFLNMRYLISRYQLANPALRLIRRDDNVSVFNSWSFGLEPQSSIYLYENKEVIPRASLIRCARRSPGGWATPEKLQAWANQPCVLVDASTQIFEQPPQQAADELKIGQTSPNELTLDVRNSRPAYLVLSETWYPGWQAFDNGSPTEVIRANFAFRAIFLDQGQHHITLRFNPLTFRFGLYVSLLTLFIPLALILIQAITPCQRRGSA